MSYSIPVWSHFVPKVVFFFKNRSIDSWSHVIFFLFIDSNKVLQIGKSGDISLPFIKYGFHRTHSLSRPSGEVESFISLGKRVYLFYFLLLSWGPSEVLSLISKLLSSLVLPDCVDSRSEGISLEDKISFILGSWMRIGGSSPRLPTLGLKWRTEGLLGNSGPHSALLRPLWCDLYEFGPDYLNLNPSYMIFWLYDFE